MGEAVFNANDREEYRCPICGSTVGWFGKGFNCDLTCATCKQKMELIDTGDGVLLRMRRKKEKKEKSA
ncbi:MAG: hypothetical protein ABTB30_08455 [Clostridia bacterium]